MEDGSSLEDSGTKEVPEEPPALFADARREGTENRKAALPPQTLDETAKKTSIVDGKRRRLATSHQVIAGGDDDTKPSATAATSDSDVGVQLPAEQSPQSISKAEGKQPAKEEEQAERTAK